MPEGTVYMCPKCGEHAEVVIAQDKLQHRRPEAICMACGQMIGKGPSIVDNYKGARLVIDLALEFHGMTRADLLPNEPGMISETEGAGGFRIINAGAGARLFSRRGEKIFRLSMLKPRPRKE